jgi:hypothetical protein
LTDKVILAGRRLALPVVLSNPSGAEGRVRLNCADDAGHPQVQEVAVPARGEKTVLVPLAPANAGYRWVNLWLEGDEFPADNRAALGFYCTERRSVLLAGQRPQFGLLPVALSPGGDGRLSGLIVQSTDAAGLREKLQEPARTFPVLTWESWKQLLGGSAGGRWRQFLESGGQALLVPAAGSDGGGLPAESGLNPAALPAERDEKGRGLVVVNPAHPLFGDLRDARGGLAWPNVRVFRWHPLAGGAASLPILGVENGPVVLAAQSVGRGTLYVSGVAFDPAWTTLPLKPAFLALAQAMAMAGAGSARNQENLTAGEPLKEGRRFQGDLRIQSLAGGPLDWKGPAADFPNFTRAGVYRVQAGSESVQVAVRSSDREGRQRFLAGDTVPALGKLDYRVTSSPAGAAGAAAAARLGKRVHLRLPLLLGAASLFLLEGWLANPAPVARRRRGAPGPGAATPSPA